MKIENMTVRDAVRIKKEIKEYSYEEASKLINDISSDGCSIKAVNSEGKLLAGIISTDLGCGERLITSVFHNSTFKGKRMLYRLAKELKRRNPNSIFFFECNGYWSKRTYKEYYKSPSMQIARYIRE